jgi:uncharacterized protein (TIGR03067 family)
MTRAAVFLLMGTWLAVPHAPADPITDDVDRLQGEWIAVKAISNGMTVDLPDSKERATFAGKNLTMKEQTGTFTIDPKAKTMRCSLVSDSSWSYRIDGDSLTIAFGTVGAKTPPDIEGKDGKPVVIYKRKSK